MLRGLIFTISFLIHSAESIAGSFLVTHERFVHLSGSKKSEVIIKTMEMVVALEASYKHQLKTSGFSIERFHEYTTLLQNIGPIFMSEAHAADVIKSWEQLGDDFQKLLSAKDSRSGASSGKCIYGGWISQLSMQGPKGKRRPVCVHPKTLGNQPAGKAYQNADKCPAPNKISCNPVVFGYKSADQKSLFCVSAGVSDSDNSALNCMRKALDDSSQQEGDSVDKRLGLLRTKLSENPLVLEKVQNYIYKSCVCEEKPSEINQTYHEYMRPHRTCYGMMKAVSDTVCEQANLSMDTSIFVKLKEFTLGKINVSTPGPEIDQLYTQFLSEVKSSSPSEYAALCGTAPTSVVPPIVTTIPPVVDPIIVTTVPPVIDPIIVTTVPPVTPPIVGLPTPPTTTTPDVPEGSTLPPTETPTPPSTEVTATSAYECKKAVCTEIAVPDKPTPEVVVATPTTPATAVNPTTPPAIAKMIVEIPMSPATPAVTEPKYSCEFTITKTDSEEAVSPSSEPKETPKDSTDTTLAITTNIDGNDLALSCPLEFSSDDKSTTDTDNDLDPKITVSLGKQTLVNQVVKAEVENKGDFKISWYRKDVEDLKFPEVKIKADPKVPERKGAAPDSSTEQEAKPEETKPKEEIPKGQIAGDVTEITEPRLKSSYKTCAKLVKPGKTIEGNCVNISAPTQARTNGPGGQQGPGQTVRPGSNTSAAGIK